MPTSPAITTLLQSAAEGDRDALEEVMRSVYDSLQQLASAKLRKRYGPGLAGATLEPEALVNETLLKVLRNDPAFANRRHFYSFANQVMTRVLIDYERSKRSARRGGEADRVTLSGMAIGQSEISAETLEVFEQLQEHYPRKSEIVGLRLFWGLEHQEIAELLGVSTRTVERDWRFARAWISGKLSTGQISST